MGCFPSKAAAAPEPAKEMVIVRPAPRPRPRAPANAAQSWPTKSYRTPGILPSALTAGAHPPPLAHPAPAHFSWVREGALALDEMKEGVVGVRFVRVWEETPRS